MAEVHNHGIDPSCRERLVGECLLKPGVVVLDPADWPDQWNALGGKALDHWADLADGAGLTAIGTALRYVHSQIEAQTKPPRIPEPGKYGVVKAEAKGLVSNTDVLEWVNEGKFWRALDNGTPRRWEDLINPVLVRKGQMDA